MASLTVVVIEPGRKCFVSFGVADADLPVGPLGGEDSVEAFDLAVLLGAVGSDQDLAGTDRGKRCLHVVGAGI